MSTNTANYNLVKPSGAAPGAGGDLVDIAVINANMDTIDAALHAHDLTNTSDDARLDALEAATGVYKNFPPVFKTADENLANNAALQNDDHLLIAIPGAGTFEIDLELIVSSAANAAGDMRVGANFPAATSCNIFVDALDVNLASGSNGTVSKQAAPVTSGVDPGIGIGCSTNLNWARVKFILVATAAGTFNFRWAQSVANASNTTMRTGSVLKMRQIA